MSNTLGPFAEACWLYAYWRRDLDTDVTMSRDRFRELRDQIPVEHRTVARENGDIGYQYFLLAGQKFRMLDD